MSDQSNTAAEKVSANWDVLSSDPVFGDATSVVETVEVKKEDAINQDVVDPPEVDSEKEAAEKLEAENKANEEKQAAEKAALANEIKELGLPENSTKEQVEAAKKAAESQEIKVSLEDIEGVIQKHPEGSYKHLAQQLGVELEEESIDSFKSKFVPKEEAEKLSKVSKQDLYASLKPEVAAALELKELGIPDELILDPTKEIDEYLRKDDAELVRADLENTEGWTEDMINTELQTLEENGKLSHEASKLRIFLNQRKKEIIGTREELVKKYTAERDNAILRQKDVEKTQFKEAMDKVSSFMGVNIPKDVKDALIAKYNNGSYDKELSTVESKVNYVLKRELEAKISKHIQNKASESAKKAVTDKLLNIPPTKPSGGGRQENKEVISQWGPIEDDFK